MADTTTPKKKILIAEDEEWERDFYTEFLSKQFDVVAVPDGEAGLKIIQTPGNKIDLILLDIMMPKVDGVNFLKTKNQNPDLAKIPVVILSNLGYDEILKICFDLGVKYYVLKAETSPDQLLNVVNKALSS